MHGDFLDHIRHTFLFGKFTGLLPIQIGFNSKTTTMFKWQSITTFSYGISFTILSAMVAIQMYALSVSGWRLEVLNPLLYFSIHWLSSITFFCFCRRIACFLEKVEDLEKLLPPTWKPRSTIRRIHRLMAVVIYFGISEHIFFIVYTVYLTQICFIQPDDSGLYMKSYFLLTYKWYFDYFPFSFVPAIMFLIIKIQAAIMWFYPDWVVTVISIYLRNRLEEFNRLIIDENGVFKKTFKPSWSELQVHYTRICKLVSVFNDHFGAIVLITYAWNVLYICLQVYLIINGLSVKQLHETLTCGATHRHDILMIAFQAHNLTCLILRCALVSYMVTEVHMSSRKSLAAMHSIQSTDWNNDMKRLVTQVHYSKVGVSGLNFFLVTRSMILGMVTQTVTYELVLAQF